VFTKYFKINLCPKVLKFFEGKRVFCKKLFVLTEKNYFKSFWINVFYGKSKIRNEVILQRYKRTKLIILQYITSYNVNMLQLSKKPLNGYKKQTDDLLKSLYEF